MLDVLGTLELVILTFALYATAVGLCGLFTKSPPEDSPPETRFAVVVPAHNEEQVLGPLIKSLKGLDYPSRLYDVVVIADNCTDSTAEVALKAGATLVIERQDSRLRGKGHALQFAFEKLGFLGEEPTRYDAVVVFDADNLVEPGFLRAMNNRLLAGEKIIQSFLDSKNPDDTWISAATSVMFWLNNRFILQARYNLGLAAALSGTGMCISRDVLKDVGWSTQTLTEDLEYSMKALTHGYRTTVAAETRTYDEKPLTFMASCRQRLRWARGQVDVAVRYIPALLATAAKRISIVPVESALRLCQLFVLVAGASLALVGILMPGTLRAWILIHGLVSDVTPLAVALPYIPYAVPMLVLAVDAPPIRPFRFTPLFPLFGYSWILLILVGMLTFRHKAWMPTRHVRDLDPDSVVRRGDQGGSEGRKIPRSRTDRSSVFAGQR